MKGDPVELTPRMVFVAVLYAAAKTFVIYVFFASVTEGLTEELPDHSIWIDRVATALAAAMTVYWALRPFYSLVVHRRDLG